MKGLREKFRKNEGFTLVEMLIVVAIIAILIAVSISLVGESLEKAREATDTANERAAIGLAETMYLAGIWEDTKNAYKIDGASGSFDTAGTGDEFAYGKCSDHEGGYITVTIANDGSATCKWTVGGDEKDPHVGTTTP